MDSAAVSLGVCWSVFVSKTCSKKSCAVERKGKGKSGFSGLHSKWQGGLMGLMCVDKLRAMQAIRYPCLQYFAVLLVFLLEISFFDMVCVVLPLGSMDCTLI